ncbi:MAG: A/G-specific adenine glycosylase [Pseudomonadota bacterium]
MSVTANQADELQEKLLDWYDRHRRVMPWRARPGQLPDPYQVWLSEIMLQQTTVTAVKPYFENFMSRWPSVDKLAEAELDAVLQCWAGLGYYARARNLHKCARIVRAEYGGRFPDSVENLMKLPGIGPYTAAAIASIAFNQPVVAVDGNVERVAARFFGLEAPLPDVKPELKRAAESVGCNNNRPADFTQAFMELGATVCTPKSPKCMICPWQTMCKAYHTGMAETLPRRKPKTPKPKRYGNVFWITDDQGRVLLRRRPESGLLGGMMEFPSGKWQEGGHMPVSSADVPVSAAFIGAPAVEIRHIFTHFELYLNPHHYVYTGSGVDETPYKWVEPQRLAEEALPSVMIKVKKIFF